MGSSMGVGFMAVFAVSGSVVLISLQAYKRLLSDFMKKIEFELGVDKYEPEPKIKKVRFAANVMEPSSNNKEYREKTLSKMVNAVQISTIEGVINRALDEELKEAMPANRRALYQGIIEYRTLKGFNVN